MLVTSRRAWDNLPIGSPSPELQHEIGNVHWKTTANNQEIIDSKNYGLTSLAPAMARSSMTPNAAEHTDTLPWVGLEPRTATHRALCSDAQPFWVRVRPEKARARRDIIANELTNMRFNLSKRSRPNRAGIHAIQKKQRKKRTHMAANRTVDENAQRRDR